MKTSKKTKALLFVIAAALVLGGCGARKEESPANTSSAESPAGAPTETSSASPSSSEPAGQTILEAFKEKAQAGQAAPDELFGELKDALGKSDTSTADELIRAMETYYDANLETTSKKFEEENIQKSLAELQFPVTEEQIKAIPDESVKKLAEDAIDGGYKLETAEGFVFPIVDYAKLQEIDDGASPSMQAYLALQATESNEATAKDAGLVITWEQLADRALAAEAFIRQYPDSPERVKVEDRFANYLNMYLTGLNNTPIFDYETFKALPEVKAQYKKTAEAHPDTVTGKLAKELLDVLAKTNDKVFDKSKDGSQQDVPEVKAFRDGLETEARNALPKA
ncbi:hypothetical protein ACFPVX_11670 [Cohnella faecalis]|uniref:Lipoprotein n=1 Tax=Cohnella faecalis TaxID=2315694 RepID=A0A398CSI7_9BACL|nr:hypothetical protein [Cohnella faecalis]RIE03708.1 hypothetical protein D3H35_10455 [Cohnella faecalis]